MRRVTVMSLVCALAFGAAATAAAQTLAERPALSFIDAGAFSRSVTARYDGVALASVLADLRSQDFTCASDGSYCTRTRMDGACADAWSVDIADDQSVSGRYSRQCMGGEEE